MKTTGSDSFDSASLVLEGPQPGKNSASDSFDQVLGNDMLRQIILNHVIHEGGQVSQRNVQACRLVQRAWLESVGNCLIKSGVPLLRIKSFTSLDWSSDSVANQFLTSYGRASPLLGHIIPPFELSIGFYNRVPFWKSLEVLKKCLRWCTSGLLRLELHFQGKAFQIRIPESTCLPALRTLELSFLEYDNSERHGIFLRDVASMAQVILSGSGKLNHVILRDSSMNGSVSAAFNTLRFPRTLTKLEFEGGVVTPDLEQLMMINRFPRLAALTIYFPDRETGSYDFIYRILGRVSPSLKTLKITGNGYVSIRLPLLRCLETLQIYARFWRWADDFVNLDGSLPVVKNMDLMHEGQNVLERIVRNNRFELTEQLTLFVGSSLLLSQLHVSFPKVSRLEINAFVRDDSPRMFQPLFHNMPQLKKLFLSFYEVKESFIVDPQQFWSLMLLGVSGEEIARAGHPDIIHLADLCELGLNLSPDSHCKNPHTRHPGKLPDSLFNFGLLRMTNLVKLTLGGTIITSELASRNWRLTGRELNYS